MKAPKSALAKQLLENPETAHALRLAVESAVSARQNGQDQQTRRSSFFVKNANEKRREIRVEVVPILA